MLWRELSLRNAGSALMSRSNCCAVSCNERFLRSEASSMREKRPDSNPFQFRSRACPFGLGVGDRKRDCAGWLASAYHVTPASFVDALARLQRHLRQAGREPERFPHALGSLFYYLTEDQQQAEELLVKVVSPTLGHPVELLRERLLIGTPAECAEKLARLQAAGVQTVFLWPVEDETRQLARFHEQVLTQLAQ